MSAPAKKRRSSMQDSEATLRQVEGVLTDFRGDAEEPKEMPKDTQAARNKVMEVLAAVGDRPAGLRDLVDILEAAYGEVMMIVESLRESRGLLEQQAMERLSSTHQRLAEVSSATEMAATGMLDGLDRSLVLVDHLEDADNVENGTEDADGERGSSEIRNELRDELHQLIGLLQFQDITSQQLGYATGVLKDIEERMLRIAQVFDLTGSHSREAAPEAAQESIIDIAPAPSEAMGDLIAGRDAAEKGKDFDVCDPEASNFDADSRQALADEIFQ